MPPVSTRSLKKALSSGYLFSFHPEQLWNSARATGPAYLVESAPGSQGTDATPRRAATHTARTRNDLIAAGRVLVRGGHCRFVQGGWAI